MGQAVKTILLILAGLASAAAVALVFAVFRQETAIHALLVQQAASRESTDLEMQRSISQLSERVDGIAATVSREIAANNSDTRGAVRRLQRTLSEDISTVRGSLAEMAAFSNRQPMQADAAPRADSSAVPRAAPGDAESGSAAVMEQDLALSQALQRAKELFGKGTFAEASRILSPFSPRQAENLEMRLYLASSRFRANPGDSSIQPGIEQDLRAVLKEEPGSLVALETMGSLCLEQGRWSEAVDWFSQVIALEPSNVDALEKAGAGALAAGDPSTARGYLERAAAIRPTDANLWYEAGSACAAAGRHEEALSRFEKCLAIDPRHHAARDHAARCLYQLGRYAEATELAGAKE